MEYVLRAIALLDTKNVQLKIIGDGPLKISLQRLAEQLNISHIIHFMGVKTQEEIIGILRNSSIFVVPSVTAKDGKQDAPINTLKEAMAIAFPSCLLYMAAFLNLCKTKYLAFSPGARF